MTQEQFLTDTIEYYSKDPSRRRCMNAEGTCKYSPVVARITTSEGCAIGRHMTPENQEIADKSEKNLLLLLLDYPSLFPEWMREMNHPFLYGVQKLHDADLNWEVTGLSNDGIGNVNEIIEGFNLNMEKLLLHEEL